MIPNAWARARERDRMTMLFRAAALAALLGLAAAPAAFSATGVETRAPITPYKPAFAGQTRAPEQKLGVAFQVTTVASGLKNPWSLAFLPDGRMLVTERTLGNLRIVGKDGTLSEPVTGAPTVYSKGQGGLLDVALDPSSKTNQLIYLSFAEPQDDGTNNTAVARGKLVEGPQPHIEGLTVIYHQKPS